MKSSKQKRTAQKARERKNTAPPMRSKYALKKAARVAARERLAGN